MDRHDHPRKPAFSRSALLVAAVLLVQTVAQARSVMLEIEKLDTSVAHVQGLSATLTWPEGAPQGRLQLKLANLDAGDFGYRWRNVNWNCELLRGQASWQCAGPLKARGAGGLTLVARIERGDLVLEAGSGTGKLRLSRPAEAAAPLRVELVRIPAGWLAPALAQVWEDGRSTDGTIDLDWSLTLDDAGVGFAGPVQFARLGIDSRDGSIAAAGLQAAGRMQGRFGDAGVTLATELALTGGEVLLGPMYVPLPDHAVQFGLQLAIESDRPWQIEALHWNDPGVLELHGKLALDPDAPMPLRAADLEFSVPALAAAHARYSDGLAATLGLAGLAVEGAGSGSLQWGDGQWQAIDLNLEQVGIEQGKAQFGVENLDGRLRLRRGTIAADSELAWRGAHLYGLELGAARLPLRSAEAGMSLREPVALSLLGGSLQVRALRVLPRDADTRFDVALALDRLNLAALGKAFGWPEFGGTISGELPSVHYAGDHLEFEGGLTARLFDGDVRVSQLSMERPFGVAPMLAASIDFSGLDLQPLTGAFGFGEITGRLDGHVRNLRLLDWEPVAFDAAFNTVKRSGVPRRISQRAVRDLTEVGGGGIAAGIQAQMLKAFASFGYERIGLSCLLSNNVCTMGGVDAGGSGGYTIVEGSGLPRVSVIGHQKRVDWPVLVARLKAATEGQMPVID